jgi:hypothetical protein
MNLMNENACTIRLRDFMDADDGWGRDEGRLVYTKLIGFVEDHPGVMVFRVSVNGVKRVDISFASETVVELARRFRGHKGFCFIDLANPDMLENWEAAASRKNQPLMVWTGEQGRVIGVQPSTGNLGAFQFALGREKTRATEYAVVAEMQIANASTKFKQLWEQGFLLRREDIAGSGGVEYAYYCVK